MSAYATTRSQLRALPALTREESPPSSTTVELAVIDGLIAHLADRVASMVLEHLSGSHEQAEAWLDSRHAAEYLGVHRDTLRKLAAERSIPSEQDGPGCKLYFRRADLDAWRHGGGGPRHLAAAVRRAA
jgi:excisionase family DNA binding protein